MFLTDHLRGDYRRPPNTTAQSRHNSNATTRSNQHTTNTSTTPISSSVSTCSRGVSRPRVCVPAEGKHAARTESLAGQCPAERRTLRARGEPTVSRAFLKLLVSTGRGSTGHGDGGRRRDRARVQLRAFVLRHCHIVFYVWYQWRWFSFVFVSSCAALSRTPICVCKVKWHHLMRLLGLFPQRTESSSTCAGLTVTTVPMRAV